MDLHDVIKPKILSLPEAADFMGVSYITLYRLVKGGKIKPLNIAKTGDQPRYGFTPDIIQRYYDSVSSASSVRAQAE